MKLSPSIRSLLIVLLLGMIAYLISEYWSVPTDFIGRFLFKDSLDLETHQNIKSVIFTALWIVLGLFGIRLFAREDRHLAKIIYIVVVGYWLLECVKHSTSFGILS